MMNRRSFLRRAGLAAVAAPLAALALPDIAEVAHTPLPSANLPVYDDVYTAESFITIDKYSYKSVPQDDDWHTYRIEMYGGMEPAFYIDGVRQKDS